MKYMQGQEGEDREMGNDEGREPGITKNINKMTIWQYNQIANSSALHWQWGIEDDNAGGSTQWFNKANKTDEDHDLMLRYGHGYMESCIPDLVICVGNFDWKKWHDLGLLSKDFLS